MPDHLSKPGPFSGTAVGTEDLELEHDRAWLSSSIRCFVEELIDDTTPKFQNDYRLPTYWWLVCLDNVLTSRCTQGLEAFSTKETVSAVVKLWTSAESAAYAADAKKFCKSSRWPWQWLGLPLDQCSVGRCGVGFLKKILRLLVEDMKDPAHRVNNDLLAARAFRCGRKA
jgi:hypothetical protein